MVKVYYNFVKQCNYNFLNVISLFIFIYMYGGGGGEVGPCSPDFMSTHWKALSEINNLIIMFLNDNDSLSLKSWCDIYMYSD